MCGNAANLIGCLVILINAQVEFLIVAAATVSIGVITTESDWGGQVGGKVDAD